jgi:hydroxymethylpyrimidine pyrophosphatase-like HAD family hydrolase
MGPGSHPLAFVPGRSRATLSHFVSYKLLALDVDGTLLRRDGSVHPADHAAIVRVAASGVVVTIVTGRLYSGTQHVARQVGLSGPVACVDGSHIVDLADDTALFHAGLVGADATLVRDVIARHEAASFLFANDTIVHDPQGAPFAGYVSTWSPRVDVVARVVDHPYWEHERGVMAVVAIGAEGSIRAAVAELEAQLSHVAHVISFPVPRIGMFAMIIRAAGPTKGTAVEWLARHHGCTVADVVVVGDWLNDVPMFAVAGRSFVMGQAPPAVKAAATDELAADCFRGGGIAEAVLRAWGI